MPFIINLYKKAKEKNIIAGIILIDLIAFISYLIFYSGIFYFGDLQMIIGCAIGTRFALKNAKPNQSLLKYGLIVGLGGAIITAISYSFFDWMAFSTTQGFSFVLLMMILGSFLIEALIIGLLIGGIISGYYYYTGKFSSEKTLIDDEFYESLIDK